MSNLNTNTRKWLFCKEWSPDFLNFSSIKLLNRYERWRKVSKVLKISNQARLHLEWMIYYYEGNNVVETCRHFGIARKTFYKWYHRFEPDNIYSMHLLENQSKAPKNVRQREWTPLQYERIVKLKKEHIRYGKKKILVLYKQKYTEDKNVSEWKIQCIIKQAKLYYHPKKQAKINRKRQLSVKRKKITDLKKKKTRGFLICVDTIIKYANGKKRYIVTAIDRYSKIAFARMYTTHSSYNARDLLRRMHYLLDGKIENIQTDNGSEFKKYFEQELKRLNIPQYYSRVKTPKDNAVVERFNRTLQEEFIQLGNMTTDIQEFNKRLTEWLIEYNFKRPHQTLDYLSPIEFHFKYHKVLPMSSSSTFT